MGIICCNSNIVKRIRGTGCIIFRGSRCSGRVYYARKSYHEKDKQLFHKLKCLRAHSVGNQN